MAVCSGDVAGSMIAYGGIARVLVPRVGPSVAAISCSRGEAADLWIKIPSSERQCVTAFTHHLCIQNPRELPA